MKRRNRQSDKSSEGRNRQHGKAMKRGDVVPTERGWHRFDEDSFSRLFTAARTVCLLRDMLSSCVLRRHFGGSPNNSDALRSFALSHANVPSPTLHTEPSHCAKKSALCGRFCNCELCERKAFPQSGGCCCAYRAYWESEHHNFNPSTS